MEPKDGYMFEETTMYPTEQSDQDLFPSPWNSLDWLDLDPNPSSYHHYNTHFSSLPPLLNPQDHFTHFHNQSLPFVVSPETTPFQPYQDAHQPLSDFVGNDYVVDELKTEPVRPSEGVLPVRLGLGAHGEGKKDGKAAEGRPSKNLMAERRRRKRLNDRLSMLRSIVPNISKMDRTAILTDTIDYIKDLLGRINTLQQEIKANPNSSNRIDTFKPSNGVINDSYPKIGVKRRESDTLVEMYCEGSTNDKLLATVAAMEELGLEFEHCAISCFNGFEVHASCSQGSEQLNSEEIKQSLLRSTGYVEITK